MRFHLILGKSFSPFLEFLCYFWLARGPSDGYRGKVVVAFEENDAAKVGVRFDKPILEGTNLGEQCEKDHGFFCSGNFSWFCGLLLLWMVLALISAL